MYAAVKKVLVTFSCFCKHLLEVEMENVYIDIPYCL
jgi:hypothetical protein